MLCKHHLGSNIQPANALRRRTGICLVYRVWNLAPAGNCGCIVVVKISPVRGILSLQLDVQEAYTVVELSGRRIVDQVLESRVVPYSDCPAGRMYVIGNPNRDDVPNTLNRPRHNVPTLLLRRTDHQFVRSATLTTAKPASHGTSAAMSS